MKKSALKKLKAGLEIAKTGRDSSWRKKWKELIVFSILLAVRLFEIEKQLLQLVKCILKIRLVIIRSLAGLRMLPG